MNYNSRHLNKYFICKYQFCVFFVFITKHHFQTQRVDYLLQCIGAMVLLQVRLAQEPCDASAPTETSSVMAKHQSHSTGTLTSEDGERTTAALVKVLMGLQEHIPHLVPFFKEELLMTLLEIFKSATVIEKMPGNTILLACSVVILIFHCN